MHAYTVLTTALHSLTDEANTTESALQKWQNWSAAEYLSFPPPCTYYTDSGLRIRPESVDLLTCARAVQLCYNFA